MTQRPTSEFKTSEFSRVAPKCLLRWTIDPVTGKPVGRWTEAQPATTVTISELPAAA